VSSTDFVNSGSYLRTVFVFISGMTTFTCFGGAVGFFGSGLTAKGGGVGREAGWALTVGSGLAAGISGLAAGRGGLAMGSGDFATGIGGFATGCVLATEGAAVGFPVRWTLTGPFLAGAGTGRLAGVDGTTFLAADLAILLAAGAFLADLLLPDEWAGLAAVAFLSGAIFLTPAAFLAGFAAFFLVAIQLGFFCNKHF
jgi:hypothetical protein